MSKTLKISAIAASLLVSGILVGCGSSNDGSSSPTPTPTGKSVIVTDDYVIGADVYAVSAEARTVYARANNTTGNSSRPIIIDRPIDEVFPDGKPADKPGDKPDDKPGDKPGDNQNKAKEVGNGVYNFTKVNPTSILVSEKGKVDINKNGKADADEPAALNMAAKASSSHINPFTTLEVYGNADVKALFGIEKADIDTAKGDAKVRKAVAYANAMLAKAQGKSSSSQTSQGNTPLRPSTPSTPNTGTGNNTKPNTPSTPTSQIIPLSYKTELAKVLEQVNASVKSGKSIGEAVAALTGNEKYAKLSDDTKSINEFIAQELGKFSAGDDSSKPGTDKPADSILPF